MQSFEGLESVYHCPVCSVPFQQKIDADLAIEVCPGCGGLFFDKGELNVLATGLAGDIECYSIDTDAHQDEFATRICPKCPEQEMRKVNLLRLSELIFDYCPHCDGFFLDKGEVQQMNDELRRLSSTGKDEEYRGYNGGHMVRVNHIRGVVGSYRAGSFSGGAPTACIFLEIVVYFRTPLGIDFRITSEKWTAKLAKLLGLFKTQDIETGHQEFDKTFIVQANDDRRALEILSPSLRDALIRFASKKAMTFHHRASIEVLDDRIAYREGPYSTIAGIVPEEDRQEMIRDLVQIAALV